jgi:hypothetical protein
MDGYRQTQTDGLLDELMYRHPMSAGAISQGLSGRNLEFTTSTESITKSKNVWSYTSTPPYLFATS